MAVKVFGATGQFPRGKASADDEGELQMGVATDFANGIVRLQFGKPVGWLGLDVGTARQLAESLLEKANEVERRKG